MLLARVHDRPGAPAGEVGLVERAEDATQQIIEALAFVRFEATHRDRHQVQRARPFGSLDVTRESEYGFFVEAIETDGCRAHHSHVARRARSARPRPARPYATARRAVARARRGRRRRGSRTARARRAWAAPGSGAARTRLPRADPTSPRRAAHRPVRSGGGGSDRACTGRFAVGELLRRSREAPARESRRLRGTATTASTRRGRDRGSGWWPGGPTGPRRGRRGPASRAARSEGCNVLTRRAASSATTSASSSDGSAARSISSPARSQPPGGMGSATRCGRRSSTLVMRSAATVVP